MQFGGNEDPLPIDSASIALIPRLVLSAAGKMAWGCLSKRNRKNSLPNLLFTWTGICLSGIDFN